MLEKTIHEMFDHIWDCEVEHPVFQDTVGNLMDAVIQAYNNEQKFVWLVTYIDGDEPTMIAFDNEEAADACYEFLKDKRDWCRFDRCEVGHTFG